MSVGFCSDDCTFIKPLLELHIILSICVDTPCYCYVVLPMNCVIMAALLSDVAVVCVLFIFIK